MRVVINAQLDPSRSGGIAQVVLGLAHGLGRLRDDHDYVFVCSPASAEWIRTSVQGNVRIAVNHRSTPAPARGIRVSDGFWEGFDPDVLHFPYQSFTQTAVPSIFNPHDLQHRHLPECFDPAERDRREALYREACIAATVVAVASEWVRNDFVRQYGVPQEKFVTIPWGPPTQAYPRTDECDVQRTLVKHRLEPGFMLYPAQTWPHKNHIALLDAMHVARSRQARDRGSASPPLVCTGAKTEHHASIERHAERLGLHSHVRFLGWIPGEELVALYRAASFVVLPTLFEAESLPLLEAFAEGVPVACARVTSLPEQAGDAALWFDPRDPSSIADAIVRLSEDASLRNELIARGRRRLTEFSWEATATAYREVYESIATRAQAGAVSPRR